MISFICNDCDGLISDTSVCPNCGKRTEIYETAIYWSKEYNTPSFEETCLYNNEICELISTDIRPVFAEERLLLEILEGKPMAYAGKSMWNIGANRYVIDGKKKVFPYSKFVKESNVGEVISKINEYREINQKYVDCFMEQEYIKNFLKINEVRNSFITEEAYSYIQNKSKGWNVNEMFVSFSGGKDSTVTSDLVIKALGDKKIPHVYCDTTLEYPTSAEYIKRFKDNNREMPFLIAKNKDQDFNNLCEVIGPPSRVLRWCCTIFKTGTITKRINSIFHDKTRLLTFQGIRKIESKARRKYDRESEESKIAKQVVVSPIIDWLDFDVWLYILTNNIDFNDAYKQGFNRVGCWCCPNNSSWSGFLSNVYMHAQYVKFYDILYSFAKKVGKEDWKEYIDCGNWKARQGGNGLEMSENAVVSFSPCALEDNAYNFTLSKPIDDTLYTLFKPFGNLDFNIGNKRLGEVYVLDRKDGQPLLKLTGRIGKQELKVSVLKTNFAFKNKAASETLIKDQITKFQTCIGCSACQSVCRFDALKVVNLQKGSVSTNTISYSIDENKCVGCLECVKHFDNGCYMKKVLRTKKDS